VQADAIDWVDVPRERDEGPRCVVISALGHACLFGLFVLAPPAVDGLASEAIEMPGARLATVAVPIASAPGAVEARLAGPAHGSVSDGRSRGDEQVGAHAPRSAPHASVDPRAALTAIAGRLRALDSGDAFSASAALAALTVDGIATGGGGPDMIGTGRGAGVGGGTIESTFGAAAGHAATCDDEELVRRTATMGRAAAIASCAALGSSGAITGSARSHLTAAQRAFGCFCGGEADVYGVLSAEAIRRVVARHRAEIRYCYVRGLERRPDLEGRVTAHWSIAPDGRVQGASIDGARTDTHAGDVESCVASAVARWTFPTSGGPTVVRYPFVLGTE
jgi:hypothetical protein